MIGIFMCSLYRQGQCLIFSFRDWTLKFGKKATNNQQSKLRELFYRQNVFLALCTKSSSLVRTVRQYSCACKYRHYSDALSVNSARGSSCICIV
jgi:hypothetical protein